VLNLKSFLILARQSLPVFAVFIACGCAAWAQPDGPMGPPPDGPPPGASEQQRGPSIERELKHLTQLLALTADQQTQVKAILTDQHQQIEALFKSDSKSADGEPQLPSRETMEANRSSIKALHEATRAKIAALLTDSQKVKFEALSKKQAKSEAQQDDDMPPPPPDGEGGPPPDGGGGPGGGGPGGGGPGGGGPPGV